MNLYRLLEPHETVAAGDLTPSESGESLEAVPEGTYGVASLTAGRFVFLRPVDANIAAALIAAEIVDAVWDGPVHGNGVRALLDRYRAAKGGA